VVKKSMFVNFSRIAKGMNDFVYKLTSFRVTKSAPIGENLLGKDDKAARTIKIVACRTMTDENRLYNLILATRYVIHNNIQGDIIECGVWRGGSMMAVAETLNQLGVQDRNLRLYDTFSGMTEPESIDRTFDGEFASNQMSDVPRDNPEFAGGVIAFATLKDVMKGMESTQYPAQRIIYVQGDVKATLHQNKLPEKISLLRLDTDWHESTKIELEVLWPRLQRGGVLILDDYDHWEGARIAVDDYFSSVGLNPFMMKMNTGRIIIKL
jgi:O-methyltransferase